MTTGQLAAVVLAAGKGTRMKSDLPKVLHRVAGLSMLGHVVARVRDAGAMRAVIVVSPDQGGVREAASEAMPDVSIAVQERQLGTADAVGAARGALKGHKGPVLIVNGDTPLLRTETLATVVDATKAGVDICVLGFRAQNPFGYGRLITSEGGTVDAIREELDASDEEKAINLCNSGVIALRSADVMVLLDDITNDNAKREYYLTDIVGVARERGMTVGVVECGEDEVLGVNSRNQLAGVEAIMQQHLRAAAMADGVTMHAPETVHLCHDTKLGRDVVIEPNVVFGPNVSVGNGVAILGFSHIEGATIADGVTVGPFARLRPGADLRDGTKVGNFVEVKNATIETGAKVNHLAYIGDARVGAGANVGAGTITCNYDGAAKHFTDIGAGAFIGSNSALVAPVSIGDGAYVGSGSVISHDVSAGALAVTRAKQVEKDGWADRKRGTAKAKTRQKNSVKG